MTFKELMQECGKYGKMPEVVGMHPNTGELTVGQVTAIKWSKEYKGIAVHWGGMRYDLWYYAEHGHDGRKKYMKQLGFN